MDSTSELWVGFILKTIEYQLREKTIDLEGKVKNRAMSMVEEIKTVICDKKLSDFEAMEGIVRIFESYDISTGGRHSLR